MGHEGPDFAINKRVLAKLAEMQPKDISCTVAFEYFPKNAIQATPNGTMAFNRTGMAIVLIMLRWDNTVGDYSGKAREIAHEVAGSILGDKSRLRDSSSFGYGNYGERPGQTGMANLNSRIFCKAQLM